MRIPLGLGLGLAVAGLGAVAAISIHLLVPVPPKPADTAATTADGVALYAPATDTPPRVIGRYTPEPPAPGERGQATFRGRKVASPHFRRPRDEHAEPYRSRPLFFPRSEADLLARMARPDPRERARTIEAWIAGGGDVHAVLVYAGSDPAPEVRRAALRSLGRSGASEAVPVLAHALTSADTTSREAAARALGDIARPEAAVVLREAIREQKQARVRRAAAEALAAYPDAMTLTVLQQTLAHDLDGGVREAAVHAIQRCGVGGLVFEDEQGNLGYQR